MVNRKRERDLIWTQKPDSSPFSSSTDSPSSDRNPSPHNAAGFLCGGISLVQTFSPTFKFFHFFCTFHQSCSDNIFWEQLMLYNVDFVLYLAYLRMKRVSCWARYGSSCGRVPTRLPPETLPIFHILCSSISRYTSIRDSEELPQF